MHTKKHFMLNNHSTKMVFLPRSQDYYRIQFPYLRLIDSEWVNVRCCFHTDQHPNSLSFIDAVKALGGDLC